jgi:hypothetical protein
MKKKKIFHFVTPHVTFPLNFAHSYCSCEMDDIPPDFDNMTPIVFK